MIQEYIRSFILIFMAEMGDKSQILAMAFATQYYIKQVLLGVLIGSLLNHGIAVLLGTLLSSIIPMNTIQIVAGFSFIIFALWTLKYEEQGEEEEANKKKRIHPVFTVAIAFFIGELGDKTQLTAITLAADTSFPFIILLGTVSGMFVTSGFGIFIGSKLGNRIPEFTIKVLSAMIFLFFGISKLFTRLPKDYINIGVILPFGIIIFLFVFFLIKPHIIAHKARKLSPLKQAALTLYEYTHHIKNNIEEICLGNDYCNNCKGQECIIGYTKLLLDKIIEEKYDVSFIAREEFVHSLYKPYSKQKLIESLAMTILYLQQTRPLEETVKIAMNEVRKNLELLLFGVEIKIIDGWDEYFQEAKELDSTIEKEISKLVFSRIIEENFL